MMCPRRLFSPPLTPVCGFVAYCAVPAAACNPPSTRFKPESPERDDVASYTSCVWQLLGRNTQSSSAQFALILALNFGVPRPCGSSF